MNADDARTAEAVDLFVQVWADCRSAVANGVRTRPPVPSPLPATCSGDDLTNPLAPPAPTRALLRDHVATLLSRREALGLSHADVAALLWGIRHLDWAAARTGIRRERKKRRASNLHVAEVQFPDDFEGGRLIQKWETGQRIPNAMDLVDWCTALGLDVEIRPMEGGDGEAAE